MTHHDRLVSVVRRTKQRKQKEKNDRRNAAAAAAAAAQSTTTTTTRQVAVNRKSLANVRVMQRNLVYVIGLPQSFTDEDVHALRVVVDVIQSVANGWYTYCIRIAAALGRVLWAVRQDREGGREQDALGHGPVERDS